MQWIFYLFFFFKNKSLAWGQVKSKQLLWTEECIHEEWNSNALFDTAKSKSLHTLRTEYKAEYKDMNI